MNKEKILKLVKKTSKELIEKINNPLHNWRHIKRTVMFSKKLLKYYPEADKFVVLVATYMHDVGIIKGRDDHNKVGTDIAERLLKENDCNKEIIKKVKGAIEKHRLKGKPKSIEEKIVRDADHLDWSDFERAKMVKKKLSFSTLTNLNPTWLNLENEVLTLPESKRMFIETMKKLKKKLDKEFPEFKKKNYE